MTRIDREISALADAVRALGETTGEDVTWTPHDLARINNAIKSLCVVRDSVVSQLRTDDHTWESIATITGVPISTWRRRHTRSLV